MVDEDDVLRNAATDRTRDRLFKQRLAQFRESAKGFEFPQKGELERAVEGREKCGSCGGEVRAVLEDGHAYDGAAADLEILLSLNCRDQGECRWASRQWRPWRRSAPLVL